jgi:murein DD-endopeptidase MepM/ murein hydrolase activator NlpD
VAVVFFASLVASLAVFSGLPAPAGIATAAVAGAQREPELTPGAPIAGPTLVARTDPNPTPNPAPRPTPAPKKVVAPYRPTPQQAPQTAPMPLDELKGYHWPLNGRLTLGFEHSGWGSRLVDGERFHDGVDIATSCGDRIRAAHGGVVLAAGRHFDDYVGWIGDLGPYYKRLNKKDLWDTLPIAVVIDDGNGYRSIYAHFEKVSVKKGQRVKAGQLIGWEGATGRASGCHLHYGLFSPYETAKMGLHPDTAKRMKLPRWEVARVNPLLVLPYREGISPASVKPKD